jgi:hypothetical protein
MLIINNNNKSIIVDELKADWQKKKEFKNFGFCCTNVKLKSTTINFIIYLVLCMYVCIYV